MAKKQVNMSREDVARTEKLLQGAADALEDASNIIARTMNIGGKTPKVTKFTIEVHHSHIKVHRCCAEYDDGTCGCFVSPPGVCESC
jgi:hypothetical protein